MKLVSIIVPVYKVEKYIKRCVESLLNQSYENIEIVLVDDGSPDECPKICDEYAAQKENIIVIHKENGGLSDARNAGISVAHGDLVTFVDSDDFVHPDYIQTMVNELAGNQKCVVIVGYQSFESESELSPNVLQKVDSRIVERIDACKLNFSDTTFRTAWGKMYTRDMIAANLFPKGKIHEDEFTTYKLLYDAQTITFVKNKIYYYFQRKDGIMASVRNNVDRIKFDAIEAYEERCRFYLERNEILLFRTAAWNLVLIGLIDIKKVRDKSLRKEIQKRLLNDLSLIRGKNEISCLKSIVWVLYIKFPFLFNIRQAIQKVYRSIF